MNWNLLIKVITGIFIVPAAIAAEHVWPWWEKQPLGTKIVTGIFVLPLIGFAYVTSFWWNDFN